MAIKKAVTTGDVKAEATNEPPSREEMAAHIEELSDPGMLAKPGDVKYVTLTSPAGAKTEVPEGIVDALKDSGYKPVK